MSKKDKIHVGIQDKDPDTAYIIQPVNKKSLQIRGLADTIEEAEGLARAIDLEVSAVRVAKLSKIDAGGYFGKGVREEIAQKITEIKPNIVIINCALSPVQQRNLEEEWKVKIIDRTGLILEIFGARAQTKEGRLQVELAALDYQRSRLVRSWTHLERQRGGSGFMGGPGERQIELDRRMITTRITKLKKDLEDVRRTRELSRKSRENVPFPVVSLVGYTNAGKSTLFNNITNADVFAEDLPFATLDPTMRKITLPNSQDAILADTVGFISDLPTHLVAAFRATLEQITKADVIVHVIDISRDDYLAQKQDVIQILQELGVDYERDERIIEVFNKIDMLDEDALQEFHRLEKISHITCTAISAKSGQGIDNLFQKIAWITASDHKRNKFKIDISDGKAIAWLYSHGEVTDRKDSEKYVNITVRIDEASSFKFVEIFGYKPVDKF